MSLSDFHAFPLMPDPTCIVVARVIVQVSRSKETSRPMIFAPTPENVQGNSVSPETRKVRLEHDPRLAFLSPLSTPPQFPTMESAAVLNTGSEVAPVNPQPPTACNRHGGSPSFPLASR